MVEVKNLVKTYGDIKAVNNISFTVNDGEILGFLGPNGAGKSTTMNIITGYISSTSGTVTINDAEILKEPKEAKKQIGYLPEIPPLYTDMTVRKYLEFMFSIKKVKLPKDEHIDEILSLTKLTDHQNRIIRNLSKGYKQRVGLAQSLLGNPPVLILDEPTVGLDPSQIKEFRNLIKGLGKKHTVIFSSHILSEVSAICDRIVVINNGEVVADAKTDELSTVITGKGNLSIEIEGSVTSVVSTLKSVTGVQKISVDRKITENHHLYNIEHKKEVDIRRAVFAVLAKNNMPILAMNEGGMSLEEAYLKLTSRTTAKGGKK
ncbi:MAG: ATP-binding cassette domain-containing protein [Ruminococcus sp.]|nr:ATP-binding cassette domain-containing protein [Ruminococcus sp.]